MTLAPRNAHSTIGLTQFVYSSLLETSSPKAESNLNECYSMYLVRSTLNLRIMRLVLMFTDFDFFALEDLDYILLVSVYLLFVEGSFADYYSYFWLFAGLHYRSNLRNIVVKAAFKKSNAKIKNRPK